MARKLPTAPTLTVMSLADKVTTEGEAYQFLESLRWGDTPVCAHCGSTKVYFLNPANGVNRKTNKGTASERRVWKCGTCRKQFSVTTNTIFHGSHISLRKWLFVIVEMCSAKNGVAAREIERRYDLTPKSAWFMLHRIRKAMERDPMAGLLSGTVVVDEVYMGGNPKNRHAKDRPEKRYGKGGRSMDTKTVVVSLVSRDSGEVRSHIISKATTPELRKIIEANVDMENTVLHSDAFPAYRKIGDDMAGHEYVDHSSAEYVRYKNGDHISTNQAEGFFSQLQRSIDGTHHFVTVKHLPRYLGEFDYRYTTRSLTDVQRTEQLFGQVGGKRLTYKPVTEQ